jgi:NAD(P)-dependent dehydrogenase (short-subunit alcohol dehydrogenase family)
MAQKLIGKSAVVSGGGDGIGRAVALAMAAEGAKVVINDIGKDPGGNSMADKVVGEIKKAGGTAVANYDSVATMAGGRNIVKTAISNFGRIDILVNCAGNYLLGTIEDMTEENWDSILAVHLRGHFSCIQAAVKEMIKQKYGRIINISSNAAFMFAPGVSRCIAYPAAKAAIMGLTATLSANLKQHGITVNAILPDAVTKLFPSKTAIGGGDKKRTGPEYVAPTIVYLATDEARNISGQYIYAAGGELCIYNRPFQVPGPHTFAHKTGQWTVDELAQIIPQMLGQD